MRGIARLFTQSVTVTTYLGTTATGPSYSDPATVSCFINDTRKLVRDGHGTEVVSSTTLYAAIGYLGTFPAGSLVTVNGREAQVIGVAQRDSAGPSNAHHIQVDLT